MTNEELAKRIQDGETALMPQLWEQVYKLVYHCANGYYNRQKKRCDASGVMIADLIQEGYFAVLDAVKAYDPASGYKFTAYLNYPLKNRFNEIAGGRGSKKEPLNYSISLDAPLGEDMDSLTLGDMVADENAETDFEAAEDNIINAQLKAALDDCLATLPKDEQSVITRHYYDGQTLTSIAKQSGNTYNRTLSLREKALKNLRRPANKRRIRSVFEFEIIESISFHAGGLKKFRNTWTSSVEAAVLRMEALRANKRKEAQHE